MFKKGKQKHLINVHNGKKYAVYDISVYVSVYVYLDMKWSYIIRRLKQERSIHFYPNMFLKYNVSLKALKSLSLFQLIFSIQKHRSWRSHTWTVRDVSSTQSVWGFLWFLGFWWANKASWVKKKPQGDESRFFCLMCSFIWFHQRLWKKAVKRGTFINDTPV